MVWTAPKTWAPAFLTAAELNEQVRDNLKAIGDAWATYTPTWNASTTNPVIGNGTKQGWYMQAGKLTFYRIVIIAGSTTTFGAGGWDVSLPFTARNHSIAATVATGAMRDVSAAGHFQLLGLITPGTTSLVLRVPGFGTVASPLTAVTATAPFTWASTDYFAIDGFFEAA